MTSERFRGRTIAEALAAMRRALGDEAVLLRATAELDAIGRALGIPVVRATTPAAVTAVVERPPDVTRLLVDTTGVGPSQTAVLAEVAAIARASGAHARRSLVVSATTALTAGPGAFDLLTPTRAVVTKADCAPWEPIASQIAGHGIAVRAVARRRSVADSLTPVSRGGLARRLLAA